MAISMTGFGRGEVKSDNYQFLVECKTINHRYCDINMRLPRKINFLEDKARNFIKDFVKRGRVDLYVKLDLIGSEDVNLKFDDNLADQYINILKTIRDKYSLTDDISVMNVAKFPDIIKTEEKEEDEDEMWAMFKEALEIALHKLVDMREAEGKKLEEDTLKRCDILSGYIKDENRMAQEIAIYADKSSITEEIVRFNSHITQLKNTVVKDDSVGRKMDFLIQEMNREINTMGSKSSDINITNLVVEVKSELEKIREQIQNIE